MAPAGQHKGEVMLVDDAVRSSCLETERSKKAIALALGLRSVRRSVRTGRRKYRMPNKGGGKTTAQRRSLYWEKRQQRYLGT